MKNNTMTPRNIEQKLIEQRRRQRDTEEKMWRRWILHRLAVEITSWILLTAVGTFSLWLLHRIPGS
jgi:hypothetical protein